MIFHRSNLLFQRFILVVILVSTSWSTWALSNTCIYPKPSSDADGYNMGGTGMGGTGAISKGTGIGGTGISPETKLDTNQLAGNVIYSQGIIEAKSHGQSRPLAKGDPICVGETIVTSQSGKLQIRMTDDGLLAIRPGSQLKIEKYAYRGTEEDISVFALLSGASRFVTGNIGKRHPENDFIRTQTATIGVRGTDHETFVILPGDGSVYQSGTYDKVNEGVTFIRTEVGEIDIHPNQTGLAVDIGEAPILLKEIPDFFTHAPYMQRSAIFLEQGNNHENLGHLREGTSREPSRNEIEIGHPSEVLTSSGENSDSRTDFGPLESLSVPELPESQYAPELPESQSLSELPELLDILEMPAPNED